MSNSKIRVSLFFLAAVVATTLTLSAVNTASAYDTHCVQAEVEQSEVLVLLA